MKERPRPGPAQLYTIMGFAEGFLWSAWALAGIVWWVVDLDLSPLKLILLGTFLEGSVLLAESPTGVVADVFSRKWSIVVSWLMIGVGMMVTPISQVFVVLLISQVIWGVGYTFQSGADTAWVTDELGYEDDQLIFRHAIARTAGVILGVAASMAASQWSIRGAMVLAGIGSIVFAAGLAVTMSETNFSPIVNGAGRSIISRVAGSVPVMLQTWRKGFQLTMGKRILRFLAISTFVASMVDEMVDRLDMKRLIEIGFPAENGQSAAFFFGLTWIAMSLITLPVMVLINRNRTDFSDRWSAVLVGGLLAGSALGVGMMAGSVLAIALFGWVLRDVVREVSLPVATAWINRQATSDVRATVLSFQGQSVAFGQLAGGLVMGALAQATNLTVAFLVGAVMLAAASLTVGTLTRNTAPSTTSSMT